MATVRSAARPAGRFLLLAFVLPGLIAFSAWAGARFGYATAFAALPLLVVYLLVPLINHLRSAANNNFADSQLEPGNGPREGTAHALNHAIPILAVPVQLLTLYFALSHLSNGLPGPWGQAIWTVSTGVVSGLFAINMSHVLMHRRTRLERSLSMLLLSTVCFGVFKNVHLNIHHRFVGTDNDHSSARRGQNVYRFLLRALPLTFYHGFRLARHEAKHRDRFRFRDELMLSYLFSASFFVVAVVVWGWFAGAFFLAQSVIAMLKLEWMNYLQHYGLTRPTNSSGQTERVQLHHAWSQEHRLTNWAMINLLRHGDHHVSPQRPFHELRQHANLPAYPLDFSLMFLVSLYPRLFRTVVHPILDRYTPAENRDMATTAW